MLGVRPEVERDLARQYALFVKRRNCGVSFTEYVCYHTEHKL